MLNSHASGGSHRKTPKSTYGKWRRRHGGPSATQSAAMPLVLRVLVLAWEEAQSDGCCPLKTGELQSKLPKEDGSRYSVQWLHQAINALKAMGLLDVSSSSRCLKLPSAVQEYAARRAVTQPCLVHSKGKP